MRSAERPATFPEVRCFGRPMRAAPGLVVCLVLLLVAAAPASAARNLITGFDDAVYHSTDAAQRDAALQTTVDEGAGVVRIDVSWASIAGATEPANPTDPADPSYNFSQLDASVTAAHAHGLDVLLTVYHAPAWAEGPNRPPVSDEVSPAGSWEPDAGAYGKFGQALATRYSGKFPNPDGSGNLPAVTHFEAWNEENLWVYIAPQYQHGKETAVEIYRGLLNAFYDGVHRATARRRSCWAATRPTGTRPAVFAPARSSSSGSCFA